MNNSIRKNEIMRIAYWMNSIDSSMKSGVQYNNERIKKIIENIEIVEIIPIKIKNNTLFSYLWYLMFLMYKSNLKPCEFAIFDGFMPIFGKQKKIGIVNDLMTVTGQVKNSFKRKILMDIYFRLLKHHAYKIIAISNTTADELIKNYNIQRDKIVVIPPIIEDPPQKYLNYNRKKKLSIRLIFIGANRTNKNIITLIKAIEILLNKKQKVLLTIIGPYSNNDIDKLSIIGSKLLSIGYLRILSNVSSEVKYSELVHSDFLVLPSFQEGFGMPCLEAFSVGVPVICSDITVFREVTNGYGLFFNPYSA